MQVYPKDQKFPYQTPKLEIIGVFKVLIGGSVIRVPIQLTLPDEGEK